MLDTGCWILDAGWAESSKLKAESSEMEGVGCQRAVARTGFIEPSLAP
ncbi:hypothetical protein D3OALGA1CA_3303 [Olavius algarvensis associated proteobacterium Delta 3]|nr:hypothetical protein D3OALGA1CA_3303 [Olavius algarvensis associated proteobacterium Delta 3]